MKPDQESNGDARRVGLRVSKEEGEAALRLLKDMGLLERNLRIQSSERGLVIPLSGPPLRDQQEILTKRLQDFSLSEIDFQSKPAAPRTLAEALTGKLPSGLLRALPESLDIIGDIAVVELPDLFKLHERTVADGILEVNKNVQVVLAKVGAVSGSERIRPLRFLAGEGRTRTVHRESGCRFAVDLAKAYFSPRLSHEHQRVAQTVKSGERVVDMFAGVGPFSILIAKRLSEVEVEAIDANPEAVELLKENVRANKLRGRIRAWRGDAKEVVKTSLAGVANRIIMNHPSGSFEFIPAACESLVPHGGLIHYYTFAKGPNCELEATEQFIQGLAECDWGLTHLLVTRKVREVAPMTWQVVVDAMVAPQVTQKSRP